MAEPNLEPWAFRIVRWVPSLLRDEPINVGVVMYSPRAQQCEARVLSEDGEFARLRRLRPEVDVAAMRNLENVLAACVADSGDDVAQRIESLDAMLSNAIQLGPQRAVLTADAAAELERIYSEYVAPPQLARSGDRATPNFDSPARIRREARAVFTRAGLAHRMQPARAASYTFAGDPMRIDFHYRQNGTHGFVQALSLSRDTTQAKAFAFTAERIRAKVSSARLTAVTESAPQPELERHAFVARLLGEQEVEIVPIAALETWASRLASLIQ